ncbi:MAG: hypothetical protein AVDCRST_MAG56-2552 [uncultured Cytophagales bacterium]|uniref:Uncharacterized protein n=1 Tax=uncultured Cytophagales bacterium TaxID=158755 RepID=A0A6J4IRY8_9SPHI|nr:MAG: hypothetical protein AVDCRST_MAG56-2552 [uncultured Cytophagales bacterium]
MFLTGGGGWCRVPPFLTSLVTTGPPFPFRRMRHLFAVLLWVCYGQPAEAMSLRLLLLIS